jgi:long-chain acyl-CoA synthetase
VDDRREIGPTYVFAPPRVFESILTLTMVRIEDASALKRRMFRFFIGHANKVGERMLNREPGVGAWDRLLWHLGNVLVYAPLRNRFGMTKVKVATRRARPSGRRSSGSTAPSGST